MGNWFYDNEFEDLLKNQVNQHRMYPSDQTWRNIQQEVHGYKKWPALTVISIFIIAALVIGTVIIRPHDQIFNNTSVVAKNETAQVSKPGNDINYGISKSNYADHSTIENITKQTIAKAAQVILQTDNETKTFITQDLENIDTKNITNDYAKNKAKNDPEITTQTASTQDEKKETNLIKNTLNSSLALNAALRSNLIPGISGISNPLFSEENNSSEFKNYFAVFTIQPSLSGSNNNPYDFDIDIANANNKTSNTSPLSRMNKFGSKLDFQFYVTPSISYRRLVDNANGQLSKSYVTAIPYASNYVVDLNHIIQNRPAMGYEVGFSLGYDANKNFAIRSGFQFNIRQYNIDAYVHSAEPASIAIDRDNSNAFLNTISGFRSLQGSEPIELKNRYYEISMPIGIDWRFINKKFVWGVSTSIQPTYTFDKEPFVITSNYKNYADGSQLMRNWNINANIETYVGYNTGKYRWQLGPQFRYQLLPTMSNSYPIREYPLDLGVKLSLIRSLK